MEPRQEIEKRAEELCSLLQTVAGHLDVESAQMDSKAGGGSLPLLVLPSACVCIRPHKQSVNTLEAFLRAYCPPIIGRIEADRFIVDLRTVQKDELSIIQEAMEAFVQRGEHDGRG